MKRLSGFVRMGLLMTLAACDHGPADTDRSAGELDYRINRTIDRITKGKLPRITKDFLLAGLTLDPQFERRFTNYSGDQIGRYLSAMSVTDTALQSINLHELVDHVILNQKADGRFGADTLSFKADEIGGPQMALLWGNGRLLNGLMDYYISYPDKKKALQSAIRLGDFLQGVADACTRPEIVDRFKSMGAMGYICFTQVTEGMVKLYNATGTEKYRALAERIYPLLPEPGIQHSHGYLNTLRGVVLLYEATGNPEHLKYAEGMYHDILESENYMITGGVPEFFGSHGSSDGLRDEGCSEADLFMLGLQLWELAGKAEYLDQAEYLLMNHLCYNQFQSGDFGHHVIRPGFGFTTSPMPGQSWWCCNYHGLQALYEARKLVVTRTGAIRKINLFYPVDYSDDGMAFVIRKKTDEPHALLLRITSATDDSSVLAIRIPHWSKSLGVALNGKDADIHETDGYAIVENRLKDGDEIRIMLHPELKMVDEQRNVIDPDKISEKPVKVALIYGPWLLSADDVYQNLFMAEPGEGNIIYLDGDRVSLAGRDTIPDMSFNPEGYLSFPFLKEATSQTDTVILRPISEASFQSASHVRHWFNVARKAP